MVAKLLPAGPSLFTFSEENTSDLPMENLTAKVFGVAMWLLRYFGWLLGGCLLSQVCLCFLKKI